MAYIGQTLTEGTRRVYTYVATASQTTFNAVYTVGAVDVYQNGVLLQPSDYTATDGTSVVLDTGAALSDEITIVCHNTFSVADTVSASQGGTFNQPVTIDGNGATVLTVDRATSDGTIIDVQKDGVSRGAIGVSGGTVYVNGVNGKGLGFYNNLIVPTDGTALTNGNADLGTSSYRFKDLYLSGGVYLGGTGSANKLDDYEEGTWTPVLSSTGSAPTIGSYSTQAGTYTKVGNLVVARCRIRATVTSAGSGYPKVTGLPFSNAGGYSGVTMGLQNLMMIDTATYDRTKFPQGATYGSSTAVTFYYMTYVTNNNNYVEFTVAYHTTA